MIWLKYTHYLKTVAKNQSSEMVSSDLAFYSVSVCERTRKIQLQPASLTLSLSLAHFPHFTLPLYMFLCYFEMFNTPLLTNY